MKKKDIFLLISLLALSIVMVAFSSKTRMGAYQGLLLAQNTIIPSLLPLLIIFLIIMKTGARDVLARLFGFISVYVFNLPKVAFPALFFGMIGGYPTGALLTAELYESEELDSNQAKRLLCFNFCGGCGFIITAVGAGKLMNTKAGLILFASNVISNIIIGAVLSFSEKRIKSEFYSFNESNSLASAITEATSSAVKSILSITAFIVLFAAVNNIFRLPEFLLPVFEITNGICTDASFSLPEISAYLAFGGLCIHMQLVSIISRCKIRYTEFLLSRVISALISYAITKIILALFPMDIQVFSNSSSHLAVFSNVNIALSILMILGCFVLVLDVNSRKKYA